MTVVDPNTLSHKDQHRLRAQLRRDGQHTLDQQRVLDYRAAKPTFHPTPGQTITISRGDQSVEVKVANAQLQPMTVSVTDDAMAAIDQFILDGYYSISGEDVATVVTALSSPKQDLLARLNARHRGAK